MARRLSDTPVPDQGVVLPRTRERVAARGAHALVVVLMLVGSVQILFLLGVEAFRFAEARAEVTRLQQQVSELETQAAQLQAVAEHNGDEAYRESLARLQGYMYPNEVRAVTLAAPQPPAVPSQDTAP